MTTSWKKITATKTPTDSAGFLLWQVYHLWQRRINTALKPYGLTHMQFVLIACIGWLTREGELLKQRQLSEFTKIDVMTVSQVLRTLEKKKLIIRKNHPQDTRSNALFLSNDGRALLKKSIGIVEITDAEFMGSDMHVMLNALKAVYFLNTNL